MRAVLILLLVLAPPLAAQEPPPVRGVIEGQGFTKIAIAIPDARAAGASSAVAKELVETIRADLDFSGYFDVVSPSLYAMVASSPSRTNVKNGIPYDACTSSLPPARPTSVMASAAAPISRQAS